jgi:phage tail-like protein
MPEIIFTIKKNRIERSHLTGFVSTDDMLLHVPDEVGTAGIFMDVLDSGEKGMLWGRFVMDLTADESRAWYVYGYATDDPVISDGVKYLDIREYLQSDASVFEKEDFMKRLGAKRFTQKSDMLFYNCKGRYLFLAIIAKGEGTFDISGMRLDQEGDIFLNIFPEIYRERDSFFHRYVSIFAEIYHDTQAEIDALPDLLDLDKCPPQLLTVYSRWLGIELIPDSFPEDVMRRLVKEAWQLNRMKGSKWAIERCIEIVTGEKPIVLEQNTIVSYELKDKADQISSLKPSDRYGVTVLLENPLDEEKKTFIFHLLNQFCPIRSRIKLIELSKDSMLDGNSYLDMNAMVFQLKDATLDSGQIDGGLVLSE